MFRRLLFIWTLLLYAQLVAQSPWKEIKEKDGIRVYTRLNEGYDFKEFKGLMTVKGQVSDFVAVLQDIESMPNWGYKIKETRLLEKKEDTVLVYYLIADTPFPYQDRDGVYKNVFQWDSSNRSLSVDIEMVDFPMDREEELIEMEGFGSWQVKELDKDLLEIRFQMQMDPGGGIPAWLANMFAGDSPYHTLRRLKKMMANPAYQKQRFRFLE